MIEEPTPTESTAETVERRARLYRLTAIILRRLDIGEADRIVTIYSMEQGKRRIVARGSRRPSSRIAGHLEPFTATRLLVARTRGLDIISQAETLEPFTKLRESEATIATSGYLCELVDWLLPEEQAQEEVYELLYAALHLLSDGRDPGLVAPIFELGLLGQLGYRPELATCVNCQSELLPETNGFSSEGGVVCPRCLRMRPDAIPLSLNALKLMRAIDRGEIERLFALRVPPGVWEEIGTALSRYIARVTGRESGARRVLAELRLE